MYDHIVHFKFPGPGQRNTPMADLRTTLLVVLRLRSRGFPASNLASKAKEMGKIKLFPTAEYSNSSKQPSDPVVPLVPCTGIFLGPSKSGKTVALISMILEQYRGVFEKIYIFSPSINIDDGWIPVKKYIEEDLGVNTEREQAYYDEWDEAALRGIIQRQRKITETSKKLEMKKLYQVLIICDDFADSPQLHKAHGALDTPNQHLGELPEAETNQRSRAGQSAIPLLLEAAQPARAGGRHRRAQRPAAEGQAAQDLRAGDPRALQLPLRLLPQAKE